MLSMRKNVKIFHNAEYFSPSCSSACAADVYRIELNPVQDFGQTCTRIWGFVYIFFAIAKLLIIRHLTRGENKSYGSSAAVLRS